MLPHVVEDLGLLSREIDDEVFEHAPGQRHELAIRSSPQLRFAVGLDQPGQGLLSQIVGLESTAIARRDDARPRCELAEEVLPEGIASRSVPAE